MHAVCGGERPPLPEAEKGGKATLLGGLAERCWQGNAAARPHFEQIRRHLQLGLRQSVSGVESIGVEEGEEEEEDAEGAPEKKLVRTLRHDLHRSHKGDYNEVHKTRAGRLTSRGDGTSRRGWHLTDPQEGGQPPAPEAIAEEEEVTPPAEAPVGAAEEEEAALDWFFSKCTRASSNRGALC